MSNKELPKTVKKYLGELGKKGGTSKSPKKMKAIHDNLEKARSKRWPEAKNKITMAGIIKSAAIPIGV